MKIDITYSEHLHVLLSILSRVRSERKFHSILTGERRKSAKTLRESSRQEVAALANLFRKLDAVKLF